MDSVEKNPIYWLGGVVAAIVATTLAVDARYAKAGDVADAKVELKRELAAQRSYTEVGFLKQRKSSLEDKVFELEAKHDEAKRDAKKISPTELKQLYRYRSELEDINRELGERARR